jgi:hypothetical protein
MSDRLASFGGSWTFISLFGVALLAWIAFNIVVAGRSQFDPYPFILLNLVLSCLAAIQAPIIMMSQKRQEAKDRLVGERLPREPEAGARDPSSARKDGPHADASMGAAGGNPANPARNHAGGEAPIDWRPRALRAA